MAEVTVRAVSRVRLIKVNGASDLRASPHGQLYAKQSAADEFVDAIFAFAPYFGHKLCPRITS